MVGARIAKIVMQIETDRKIDRGAKENEELILSKEHTAQRHSELKFYILTKTQEESNLRCTRQAGLSQFT